MIRVGKATAGILLLATGGALLADRTMDTNYLGYAVNVWPVVFILLGLEYLWTNVKYRSDPRPTRLDVGGVLLSVILCAVIVGSTQIGWPPTRWFNGFDWQPGSSMSGESGHKFRKEPVGALLAKDTSRIVIDNPNGSVELKAGDTDRIQAEAIVWVDRLGEEEARKVADGSKISVTEGETVRIDAAGQLYSGNRKPRMNLIVTIPAQAEVDLELQLRNGKVSAENIPVKDELVIRTTNGTITVSGIDGKVIANTTNGSIKASGIKGMADLGTTNGSIAVSDVSGDAVAKTTNSSVQLERIRGKADASTENGAIAITEAERAIKAKTTNGAVTIQSHIVGGDWDVGTTNGRIELLLPQRGSYDVDGKGSKPSTDLPLTASHDSISGKIGSGEHKIKLETSNGAISINRID